MEAEYNVQQLDIDAMEEEAAAREADIDADEEANVVADWDQAAANRAYEEQMLAAEAEEDKRVQAEMAWWEEHGAAILAQEEARPQKRVRGGRPKKADMIQAAAAAAEAAAKAQAELEAKERGSKALVYPWDIEEDLVLVAVVYILCKQGESGDNGGAFIWNTASGALAAGCAARDAASSQIALRKGKLRTADACRKRYRQLELAYLAAKMASDNDVMGSEQYIQQLIAPAIQGLDASLKEAEKGKGPARTAVSTIAKALEARRDSKMANDLAIEMHSIRMGTSRWSALLGQPVDESVQLSLPLAAGIVMAVKGRCADPQAVQKIEGRLAAVIQAATIELASRLSL